MLTKLSIKRFKLFDEVEIELGDRVVFVGPNNSGKTSALQALALWDVGAKRWVEKRGAGDVPPQRPGVTINRRDLLAVPIPASNLLWLNLRTQEPNPKGGTQKVYVQIALEGVGEGVAWSTSLEFYHANDESFYCRVLSAEGEDRGIPDQARNLRFAYLPPMSGLAPVETRLDEGAINVRMGEGRTAEVLRNVCWMVRQGPDGEERWKTLADRIDSLFGTRLDEPMYWSERGEITLSYRTREGVKPLDISSSGRGQQQTLLLLAHMAAHPGSVLLLDEPDAHLEILRQRQIYQILSETAAETGSQIIAASHSEVILNEAADRDIVIAFVGKPHRIDDRGSQVLKSLKEIGYEQYYQAEEVGWVLYLEGATDLAILNAFAQKLGHEAQRYLERPFVHYVGNQPKLAQNHFHALREAKGDLVGLAIYDRLELEVPTDGYLRQTTWRQQELENYVCAKETLLAFASDQGTVCQGELFADDWCTVMRETIDTLERSLENLGKPGPWSADLKVTDEFLDPLFANFFEAKGFPNLMRKTDYHILVPFVQEEDVDEEIREKLDLIVETGERVE